MRNNIDEWDSIWKQFDSESSSVQREKLSRTELTCSDFVQYCSTSQMDDSTFSNQSPNYCLKINFYDPVYIH